MAKSRGIQREGITWCFDLTFFFPDAAEWVGICTLQDKHTVLEHSQFVERLGMRGGEIDVPLAVDVVNLWRPDKLAHRAAFRFTPDNDRGGGA